MVSHSDEGVIVGTSRGQEWLLPWWWVHYQVHNTHPVTFVDFGDLSPEALAWCHQRGPVVQLALSDSFMAKRENIAPEKARLWSTMHPNIWFVRFEWFKKPFALHRSTYQRTVWIDLDCQVRGSIAPLFALNLGEAQIAVAPEPDDSQLLNLQRSIISAGQTMYNAGVVVCQRGSKLIDLWVEKTLTENAHFCSDQQLLVHLLHSERLSFCSLARLYNWTVDRGENPDAVILHWWGRQGKELLKQRIDFMNRKLAMNLALKDFTGRGSESILKSFYTL